MFSFAQEDTKLEKHVSDLVNSHSPAIHKGRGLPDLKP